MHCRVVPTLKTKNFQQLGVGNRLAVKEPAQICGTSLEGSRALRTRAPLSLNGRPALLRPGVEAVREAQPGLERLDGLPLCVVRRINATWALPFAHVLTRRRGESLFLRYLPTLRSFQCRQDSRGRRQDSRGR